MDDFLVDQLLQQIIQYFLVDLLEIVQAFVEKVLVVVVILIFQFGREVLLEKQLDYPKLAVIDKNIV